MITKLSSTYLSHKRGGLKGFPTRVFRRLFHDYISKYSTDEKGEPIAVLKTCLQCFPQKVKFFEFKHISSQLIMLVVDKYLP